MKPLESLERIKYKISYQIMGTPKHDHLYYLSPRTLTKRLSLTINGYEGFSFDNARIAVETDGGFHKDNTPSILISKKDGIETLHWSQLSPMPGELYRTLWSNANFDIPTQTNQKNGKKNKVLSLAERLPRA